MRVRLDQPHPVVKGDFNEFKGDITVIPQFPFQYFERPVKYFELKYGLRIVMREVQVLGLVMFPDISDNTREFKVLETQELIAAKWSIKESIRYPGLVPANITCLIYPSGKISIYFEDIPTKIDKSKKLALMGGSIYCSEIAHRDKKDLEIRIPTELIKSRTLVEFETIGKVCGKYDWSEKCRLASTANTICIWCERAKKCIESNDQSTHQVKINECRAEEGPDVSDLSTPTPIKHNETTLAITEVQVNENLKETTEETDQHSVTIWYLVINPTVLFFFRI
ncbi:unnamed protein product [Schistosoma haematobium]|nr:unnamed protein product [Schistosoma haematobium]